MTSIEQPEDASVAPEHAPFVVSHPCPVCNGRGSIEEQACVSCHATGAARLFHGTKAHLEPGELIEPGRSANFGNTDRTTTYVYLTATLDAAVWGAELAAGEGPGRIYVVEPIGPIEDDPNLTDKRYPGNPTRSYRSREALRITGEVTDWQGHPPEQLEAMRDGLERLARQGVVPIDD